MNHALLEEKKERVALAELRVKSLKEVSMELHDSGARNKQKEREALRIRISTRIGTRFGTPEDEERLRFLREEDPDLRQVWRLHGAIKTAERELEAAVKDLEEYKESEGVSSPGKEETSPRSGSSNGSPSIVVPSKNVFSSAMPLPPPSASSNLNLKPGMFSRDCRAAIAYPSDNNKRSSSEVYLLQVWSSVRNTFLDLLDIDPSLQQVQQNEVSAKKLNSSSQVKDD